MNRKASLVVSSVGGFAVVYSDILSVHIICLLQEKLIYFVQKVRFVHCTVVVVQWSLCTLVHCI